MADRAVAEFFDGRTFGQQNPAHATPRYRGHVTDVLGAMADTYADKRDLIRAHDDDRIGRVLDERIRSAWIDGGNDPSHLAETSAETRAAYGQWIKSLFDEPISHGKSDEERAMKFPKPDWRQMYSGQIYTGPFIEEWASNDTYDIMPTVDEQITHLRSIVPPEHPHQAEIRMTLTGPHTRSTELKEFVSVAMRHKTERLLPKGTQITVKDAGVAGRSRLADIYIGPGRLDSQRDGIFTVTDVHTNYPSSGATCVGVDRTNASGIVYFLAHHVVPLSQGKNDDTPEKEDSMTAEPIVEVPDVESIRNENESLKRQVEILNRQVSGYRSDADVITSAILQEAENRGWCDEYERVCDRINAELTYIEMPRRTRTFEVSIEYTVSDSGTYTMTVEADNEDDAVEQAREQFENESHDHLWNNGDGNTNATEDDYDVSEA
jgi:hypothetical protein